MSAVVKRIGPITYDKAAALLGGRGRKVIGPNTEVQRGDGIPADYLVVFHGTTIIRLTADGAILLFTGGHRTTTTKQRLNALSPARVAQRNYDWFVDGRPFTEGMNVGAPRTTREVLERAAAQGDELAVLALADLDREDGKVSA